MWDMFRDSFKLFIRGKLFREPRAVLRQWMIGLALTITALLLLRAAGLPLGFAVIAASFGGGVLQPYLFKDLKYN